ncbi:MAG: hypothetical protein FJ298_16220 [Planctomycetes bacterium]|nr:hypothetical protein [Planctomycetota bacterium]
MTLSVAIATTSSLGVVKAGSGLTIAADGTLAVDSTTAADALGPDPLHYYIHKQTTAATVWNVRHPLGKIPTGLLVVLSNGMVAEPDVQVSFTAGIQHYEHVQGAASASWTVAHGLGQMPSGVMVYDSGGNKIEPDIQIDTSAPYNVNLTFTEAVVGRCEVSIGGDKYPMTLTFTEAVSGSAYVAIGSNLSTYVHTQGSANTTWTINHGLGRVPACLQVLDNAGNKLEPDITVLVSSPFTVTLTFTAATAGTARLS